MLFIDTNKSSFRALKDITIPPSVNSIGNYAFEKCTSIKDLVFSSSVISFGNCSFSECSSLTKVTIPYCAMSIGKHIFQECNSLEEISIPCNVNVEDLGINQNVKVIKIEKTSFSCILI